MKKKSEFKPTRCKGCYYWRPINYGRKVGQRACHYCLETGNLRGILPHLCYQHEGTPYTPERKRKEPEQDAKL